MCEPKPAEVPFLPMQSTDDPMPTGPTLTVETVAVDAASEDPDDYSLTLPPKC